MLTRIYRGQRRSRLVGIQKPGRLALEEPFSWDAGDSWIPPDAAGFTTTQVPDENNLPKF